MLAETERLILRSLGNSDYCSVRSLLEDDRVMRGFGALSETECRRWLNRQLAMNSKDPALGMNALLLKESGEFIGISGIASFDHSARAAELGYALAPDFWHNGYASEALMFMIGYAFSAIGAAHAFAVIDIGNAASARTAERCGMHRKSEVLRVFRGAEIPHHIYSVRRA